MFHAVMYQYNTISPQTLLSPFERVYTYVYTTTHSLSFYFYFLPNRGGGVRMRRASLLLPRTMRWWTAASTQ